MNHSIQTLRSAVPAFAAKLLTLVLLSGSVHLAAQSTVTPNIADKVQPADPNAPAGSTLIPEGSPLVFGPVTLHPQLSYSYFVTDGLQPRPGAKANTDIQTIAPSLSAEIGRHWKLRYAQTWNQYSNKEFRDTTEQALGLSWQTEYEAWSLTASHTTANSDSPMIETGQQTKETSHTTSFDAAYAMGSKYALDTTLTQQLLYTKEFEDPRTWSIREMLRQKTTPDIDIGVGVEYNYTAIKKTPDTASTQLLANVSWRPVKQVNASLEVGIEKRHIYSVPASNKTNPIYTGTVQFMPTASTQIGASVSRTTSASVLGGQLFQTEQYSVSLNQRLLSKLQFAATYGHSDVKYSSTLPTVLVDRKDKIDTVGLSLGTSFFTRLSASLKYQYTNNSSNDSGYKFSSNQIGVELTYSF